MDAPVEYFSTNCYRIHNVEDFNSLLLLKYDFMIEFLFSILVTEDFRF